MQKLKAFQIRVNGKVLDYRLGKELNLDSVRTFFEKRYRVRKLWSGGRHMLGILEKDSKILFLKLATTEGISVVTKNEYSWNEQFNELISRQKSNFWVPKNQDCGLYNNLFYLITDYFDGELLSPIFQDLLPEVIEFSELIQNLNINLPTQDDSDYKEWFIRKSEAWFNDIPKEISEKYQINNLMDIVKKGVYLLEKKPRHGDFTPWHLIRLKSGQLGLIDGEHAMANGVEYYDIGYFIQRVFSELKNQQLAEKILSLLLKRNYNLEKLQVILATRAIGGFLDESLKPKPDYENSNKFKNWVLSN